MNKLKEVIAYLLLNYKYKDKMHNDRLNKLIYLVDWKNCIEHEKQLTTLKWYLDNYGAFTLNIENEISQDANLFIAKPHNTPYPTISRNKLFFYIKNDKYKPVLTHEEIKIIDHVLKVTSDMRWREFIQCVYATYPIVMSNRYTYLDLVEKAKAYKEEDFYKNSYKKESYK